MISILLFLSDSKKKKAYIVSNLVLPVRESFNWAPYKCMLPSVSIWKEDSNMKLAFAVKTMTLSVLTL